MGNNLVKKQHLFSTHINGEYRKYMNWSINQYYQKFGEQLSYRHWLEATLDRVIEQDAQWQEECQNHKCEIEECDDKSLLMKIYDDKLKTMILDLLRREQNKITIEK